MGPDIFLNTSSHEETQKLGQLIGEAVQDGTVILLFGDLGSGKTTFVQGLARGLGLPDDAYVTSPSYTLINEYQGRCRLFHIDLYRITDPSEGDNLAELDDLGLDDIVHGPGVVAIEWSERLPDDYLTDRLCIALEILDAKTRSVSIFGYGLACRDLIKKIKKLV